MNVIYAASRNYYPYLRWAINSLLEFNKNCTVYVIAEDDELPFEFPTKVKVTNVSNQEYFGPRCPNIQTQFTYLSLMRVCTPELIKANKVIQLDVDTIVCDSLEPLWNIDLKGKWVGWCPEHRGTYKPYGPLYYNFGVAVLNLAQMRKDGATEQMVQLLNSRYCRYIDQDAMNLLALPDKSVDIDVRFNECFCCGETDNPAIVHYAGRSDWHSNQNIHRVEYLNRIKERYK